MAPLSRISQLAAALLAAGLAAVAQTPITLEHASSRRAPDQSPAYQDQIVVVKGVAATRSISIQEYCHLSLQEEDRSYGLTLDGPCPEFSGIEPGDELTVTGKITQRAGLPVLQPSNIRGTGHQPPPKPLPVSLTELNSFRRLGMLVQIDSVVVGSNETAGGDALTVGGTKEMKVRVFLPIQQRKAPGGFTKYTAGDHVRIVGLGSQYCPSPPFTRSFQLVVASDGAITLIDRGWILSPDLLLLGLSMLMLGGAGWWSREHAMSGLRVRLRALYHLAEDVMSAATPADISRKLLDVFTLSLYASNVCIYVHNPASGSLERVPTESDPEPLSFEINNPSGALPSGAAMCFRNRSMLYIPDARRSPLIAADSDHKFKGVLLAPMMAQREILGVLAILFEHRGRRLTKDEQAALQHLANQMAISIRLQEQQSVQDQLLRSEKMAAAGQLISSVAIELRTPLATIHRLATRLLTDPEVLPESDIREIAYESHRSEELVGRLVSFSQAEQTEFKPLDLIGVLSGIVRFREREWQSRGFDVSEDLPTASYIVLGNQSQIEQVLLNLMVHAEQTVTHEKVKSIHLGAQPIHKKLIISIDYTDSHPADTANPFLASSQGGSLSLQVCHGMIKSHEGEIRWSKPSALASRFELELPLNPYSQAYSPDFKASNQPPSRVLTAVIVEPDVATQRKLLLVFGVRGHRAITTTNAEQALDILQRIPFDAVLCSSRLPGMDWTEFSERIRSRVDVFVLMTETYTSELNRAVKAGRGHVLHKPVSDEAVHSMLRSIEISHDVEP